jgi:hypothetical protein
VPGLCGVDLGPVVTRGCGLVHEVLGTGAQAVARGGARCASQVLDRGETRRESRALLLRKAGASCFIANASLTAGQTFHSRSTEKSPIARAASRLARSPVINRNRAPPSSGHTKPSLFSKICASASTPPRPRRLRRWKRTWLLRPSRCPHHGSGAARAETRRAQWKCTPQMNSEMSLERRGPPCWPQPCGLAAAPIPRPLKRLPRSDRCRRMLHRRGS